MQQLGGELGGHVVLVVAPVLQPERILLGMRVRCTGESPAHVNGGHSMSPHAPHDHRDLMITMMIIMITIMISMMIMVIIMIIMIIIIMISTVIMISLTPPQSFL
jgi:hypothetical protein